MADRHPYPLQLRRAPTFRVSMGKPWSMHGANEPSLIALQSFTWPHQQRPHAAPKNYVRRKCHTCWGGRLNYVPSRLLSQPASALSGRDKPGPAIPAER